MSRDRAASPHGPGGALKFVALDLDGVLGDTRPLWRAFVEDTRRRLRLGGLALPEDRAAAAEELDRLVGNWRALLARFAQDHAPVYLRPDGAVNAALRRLKAEGARIDVITDAPDELARVALAQLGLARYVDSVTAEPDPDALVVRTRAELP